MYNKHHFCSTVRMKGVNKRETGDTCDYIKGKGTQE